MIEMRSLFSRRAGASVRPIGPSWAPDCALLHAPAFAYPWSEFEFERLLAAENAVADGAFDADGARLFGFVLSRKAADEAEILTLVVGEEVRKRGLAQTLMRAHIARLAALGVRALFLEVEESNRPALALYEKLDFRDVGSRGQYYRKGAGQTAGARVLRRDLG
jgi:ribosomal-protein-alanine N-acetyltransferase